MKIRKILSSILLIAILMQVVQPLSFAIGNEIQENKVENKEEEKEDSEKLDNKQEPLDEDLKEPEQQEEVKEQEEKINNEDNDNEEEKKEEIVQEKTETRGALKSPTKSPSNDENLVFQNGRFEQYLIDCDYDRNNDGGISRSEIENIYNLYAAPDIEYPEYFVNLFQVSFRIECTLENVDEKYNEIAAKANLIGYEHCEWAVDNVKVNLGEIPQSQDAYTIDLNEIFNRIITKESYVYHDYSVFFREYSQYTGLGYSTSVTLQNDVVSIDRSCAGKYDMALTYEMMNPETDSYYDVNFEFVWTTLAEGDNTKEVEFADNTLKNYILNNYDYDDDGIITEFDMAQITELYMKYEYRITSLSGIEYATNLKLLGVYMYDDNSDTSQLAQLTNLERLYMNYGDVKEYIKDLPNLREVMLNYTKFDVNNMNNNIESFSYYGNYITNLKSITNKENITSICLRDGRDTNYDFFGGMTNLQNLQITCADNCSIDIDKLKDLENLTQIHFSGVTLNNINSFSEFKSTIKGLGIENCGLTNIEFIEYLPNLENHISLKDNKIKDISPLNGIFNNSSGYIDLRGNNINPDEAGNAATIAYFNENDIYYEMDEYDESEEVIFNDENLKNYFLNSTYPKYDKNNDGKISVEEMKDVTIVNISNNVTDITGLEYATNLKEINLYPYNNVENIDLSPIYNLSKIEKIGCSGKFLYSIENFDFLNNKTSLKELAIGGYNQDIDLEGIEQYINLEKISLGLSNSSHETRIINIQLLNDLNKLKDLRIGMSEGSIPTADIALVSNIEHLELSGKLDDFSDLFSMHNLSYLRVDSYSAEKQNYDLTGIGELENLKTFNYCGYMDAISNVTELNKVAGLEEIILSVRNNIRYYGTSIVGEYKASMAKEQVLVDSLQNLNCNNIKITPSGIYAYVGDIQVGQQKTISFDEVSPIISALMTPGNKLYNENATITKQNGSGSGNNYVTVDSNNKTITINASDDVGEKTAYLELRKNYGSDYSASGFNILWRNIIPGDTSKVIEFEDENLRNALLEEYDIDGDNEITENDIINITKLYIDNRNIHSLSGIENAVNLKAIYANDNYISDISPIINMENLYEIFFENNLITDISCIENAKWPDDLYEEEVDFLSNFIDFEENNANYNALEKWMCKDTPDGLVSYMFVATIKGQNYGNVEDINNVVELDSNLKDRLTELGIDANNDGIITREELYRAGTSMMDNQIDLSNCNIESISGLEFLNIGYINLSNNDIEDITPITNNQCVYSLDLSNNNITSIEGIAKAENINVLVLSNNSIEDINPITNMVGMQEDPFVYWHYGYRNMDIDLSNNRINNISCVKNWKNIANLDLSNNHIGSISALKDYNFVVSEVRPDYINGSAINIDLSNNYINMENEDNIQAKAVFDEKGATLIVDNQGMLLGDINDDGKINVKDWNRLYEYIMGVRTFNEDELARADINGDGKANVKDWNRMYEHIMGIKPLC